MQYKAACPHTTTQPGRFQSLFTLPAIALIKLASLILGSLGGLLIPPTAEAQSCGSSPTVIYHGGDVVTMNSESPLAQAIAISGDTLLAVGSDSEILELAEPGCTRTADLGGRTILPGFIDAHAHWFSWREHICSVTGETSYPELDVIMAFLSAEGWTGMSELNFGRPDFAPEHFNNATTLDLRGDLKLRLNGYWGTYDDVSMIDVLADANRQPRFQYSPRVRATGVKIYVDEPFGGFDLLSQDEVNALVQRAHNAGWQIAAHAVNQSAVEKILSAYESVLGSESNEAFRHRIEHAVKVTDDQLQRMQDKGIIASFQLLGPADWPDQSDFDDRFLETNPEFVLRWQDFLGAEDGGGRNVGSSDAPFNDAPCDPSPFRLIYQAVTRDGYVDRTPADWELSQRISVSDAIKLLTIDAAYATFEEDLKGSLEPGKWADFIITSDNPLEVETPEALLDITVLTTLVGGGVEYCNTSAPSHLCTPTAGFPVESGTVTASQYLPDQTPDLAFDGDNQTNWGAGAHAPQWIQIELNEPMRLGGVNLVTEQSPDGPTRHEIWAAEQAAGELSLLHEFVGTTTTNQTLSYTAPDNLPEYRSFRIVTTESPSWVSWREITMRPYAATATDPVDVPNQVSTFKLFPNPARGSITMTLQVDHPNVAVARFTIFDVRGRRLRTLNVPLTTSGLATVNWAGRDELGRTVAPGVYLVRTDVGAVSITRHIALIR